MYLGEYSVIQNIVTDFDHVCSKDSRICVYAPNANAVTGT